MDQLRLYDHTDVAPIAHAEATRIALRCPGDPHAPAGRPRIRVLWGQRLLDDLAEGRYRTVICGVNDADNSQGVLGDILRVVPGSQWTIASATSYARVFRDAISLHAKEDREPFVLKFDLDRLLILALLRPAGRTTFSLEDIENGFRTVRTMLEGRRDRQPVATVGFLGGRSNPVRLRDGSSPSLEAILRAMHGAGFEGDLFPPPAQWLDGDRGVCASYPA